MRRTIYFVRLVNYFHSAYFHDVISINTVLNNISELNVLKTVIWYSIKKCHEFSAVKHMISMHESPPYIMNGERQSRNIIWIYKRYCLAWWLLCVTFEWMYLKSEFCASSFNVIHQTTENMDCILNVFLHRQLHVIKVIYVIKVKY